jgi:hypothetical protein
MILIRTRRTRRAEQRQFGRDHASPGLIELSDKPERCILSFVIDVDADDRIKVLVDRRRRTCRQRPTDRRLAKPERNEEVQGRRYRDRRVDDRRRGIVIARRDVDIAMTAMPVVVAVAVMTAVVIVPPPLLVASAAVVVVGPGGLDRDAADDRRESEGNGDAAELRSTS